MTEPLWKMREVLLYSLAGSPGFTFSGTLCVPFTADDRERKKVMYLLHRERRRGRERERERERERGREGERERGAG